MSGGSRIVAFGPGSDELHLAGEIVAESEAPPAESEIWLDAAEEDAAPLRRAWPLPLAAALVCAGWTGFFLWANAHAIAAGITPRQGIDLVGAWSLPVLLICAVWLLAMRNSRREAIRFGEAARSLSVESARLENRLTVVNRELSLAREFIAAQSRDLEALGRIAGERLSEHADRLQGLVRDNGAQVDAIATVSTTALDNMERLRGQLPVIASSAKDVANNIAHAGRSAQTQLAELTDGLHRLEQSGESSGQQVASLTGRVDAALGMFDSRLEQLQQLVAARIEELEHRGTELRTRLDADETAALDALRERASTLAAELEHSRSELDGHEAEALTSLRARLSALRDEATALARSLRDAESGALKALDQSKDRLEHAIRSVVERLDKLDRDALLAARNRIAALSEEAGSFDDRLAERNRQFAAETERRLAEATERHDAELARLTSLFAKIDADIAERTATQAVQQQALAGQGEAIANRLESLSDRIAAISAFGTQTEETLGNALHVLADRLTASRESLAGTDNAIERLTDGSIRLLELLQASTEQSREQLPAALASGEARLAEWEHRVGELRAMVDSAAARGGELAENLAATRQTLARSFEEISVLQANLGEGASRHGDTLAALRDSLADIDRDSIALAQQAQDQLAAAIERLSAATREVVGNLADETQGAVRHLADRLGEESAAAIDRTLRIRMAEAVGQLEQASGHAAGVSREAAIQLRDQLARVDELAKNLERRVAHARERAEDNVDNDFSRRVALITESLNSNAIDIAKALSTEVTDTAWASYLKGDRGVFTRRAVRLLDTGESREIARIYDADHDFRDHVSRYIHDFEAMLRQLLSTRDGHALGVTLLSSDMGKLYVALAQGIERLRN